MSITHKILTETIFDIDHEINRFEGEIKDRERLIEQAQETIQLYRTEITALQGLRERIAAEPKSEPELKIDDKVQIYGSDGRPITGRIVNINDPGNGRKSYRIAGEGVGYWRSASEITKIEPESELKIGDTVQMIIHGYQPLTGVIANITPGNRGPMYRVVAGGLGYWRRADEFTKVEPELKIGDTVEVLNARTINQPRVIGTITDSLDRLNWTVKAGGTLYYRSENSLRKVEPESKTEEPRKRGGLTTGKRDN